MNLEKPRGRTPTGLSGTVWSVLSLDGQLVKKEGGVVAKRNGCSSKPALRPGVSQAVTDRRPHKQGLKGTVSADSAQLGRLLFKCSSFKTESSTPEHEVMRLVGMVAHTFIYRCMKA